ncbi:GON-4-like protein isoform X2 [Sphaeramia orbicularis]|uniref:GON-4-like protein isoform X2 n=1 Tax=Sphaeramia orbicularis TaxID=375764 RepID=UPI00117DB4FE|nr:GON-4-like protein isoform X2 [Sphaeramia orbicularis]
MRRAEKRHPAEQEVFPVRSKFVRTDGQTTGFRQEECPPSPASPPTGGEQVVSMETSDSSDNELGRLDIDLDWKSRRHNLTSRNVRAILHEVITHEHVVAMMKAAIRDTQDLPMFEPKMTRSRLKQAVEQGQPVTWSLSAMNNTIKSAQFVDIDLSDDEDSSDEEYCPDEEDEDDTAEEIFLSDADSLASPPRMHLDCHRGAPVDRLKEKGSTDNLVGQAVDSSSCTNKIPLCGPPETSFMERLKAVEEELDCSPAYIYQSLDRKQGGGGDEGSGCLAFRTRSKRPLVNVPLDQLEAELLPPDITADMYDQNSAHQEEDRHWTRWLQGLMAPDYGDEADDDDDPEYNFLEDLDEPDLEDYRTDRAVQITKKEVNELLEELFETLREEQVSVREKEEEEEEEEEEEQGEAVLAQAGPQFNIPQALRFEAPLADMITERRMTVRKQYEAQQQRRALQDTTNYNLDHIHLKDAPSTQTDSDTPVLVLPGQVYPTLHLNHNQKQQLQQQIQQHIQLLTQVHLLSRNISALDHEAIISRRYLEELHQFACRQEEVVLVSSFRGSNLQGSLELLQEVEQRERPPGPGPAPASRRLLPRMTPTTNSCAFPLLPSDTAWLFATRPVFLYPELLPVCSLDPALHMRHNRSMFTKGEDGLIVLGMKHFEGAVQPNQLISTYLLCKKHWNLMKRVKELNGSRAPANNVVKYFLTHGVVPSLPLACSRVLAGDQRPPVDKDSSSMPNWLKNSQEIIQKTRLVSTCPPRYPASRPPGCILRLHPYWIPKSRPPPQRRLFTLAHNASLLPLAKAPEDKQEDRSFVPPLKCESVQSVAVKPGPTHPVSADIKELCPPIGQIAQQSNTDTLPLLLPISSLSSPSTTAAAIPSSSTSMEPGFVLLQMLWTPTAPPSGTFQKPLGPVREEVHPMSICPRVKEEQKNDKDKEQWMIEDIIMNKGENTANEEEVEEQGGDTGGGGSEEDPGGGEGEEENQREDGEEGGDRDKDEGGDQEENGGENGGGDRDEDGGGDRDEDGGGDQDDQEEDGEKDKDEDQERQGEEEEEEDFDDLTQDEDEEEVMSSASEESVLSVPELQETMKQLTWLAAERRLCADGDSEEDHSPTSAGSQEEEEEEEEEGPTKGEESREGRGNKVGGDEETPSGEGTPRGGGRGPGRGRGRSRPPRGLRRSRQERHSKDTSKLLLLYDENILDNDPHRESKDVAFAQSYLNRVREALQDAPVKVEEFVSLLSEFEQVGEGQEVVLLFRRLRSILGERTDLLRDFAAFLRPDQALECGLFEEQQAFDRSRRFLRQLEISFGDNPSHYQKIIKALQTGPDLSPTSIHELKAQMAALLKGHTHLQAEFWVFFDELRPPPARPGQFEEAHWPEDAGGGSDGGEGIGLGLGGGASSGFEEVTLPELEEEEEGHKIRPMVVRRQRRKIETHRNYKECDWPDKAWPCLCHQVKIRRHRKKECSRCHGNKSSGGVSRAMKSLDPLYAQMGSAHDEPVDKDRDLVQKEDDDSPLPDCRAASWEGSFPLNDEKEEEEDELEDEEDEEDEEETKSSEKEQSPALNKTRRDEALQPSSPPAASSTSSPAGPPPWPSPPRPSPPPDLPVCAKNISLTASGEKVILWTREADRVILTTCQQEGANQNTFQEISSLLGNKTPSEVSQRFRDLMRLFRTAARQTSSEDEAPPTEAAVANEDED